MLMKYFRFYWPQISNFNFGNKNGVRPECVVSEDEKVPFSVSPECKLSKTISNDLKDSLTNFCQQFSDYVEWGVENCSRKNGKKAKKVAKKCHKAKRKLT